MDSKKFMFEIESRLTALSPEMVPGVLKRQYEKLNVETDSLTPNQAKQFIDNVTEALFLVLGPEGSSGAKKLMMRKLRQCCSNEELEAMIMV